MSSARHRPAPDADPDRGPADPQAPDPAARDAAIAGFWSWWNDGGGAALDAMFTGVGDPIDVHRAVGDRIAAVDPRLAWGFGPGGEGSRHLLTITAGGDPLVRATARRMVLAGPDDDATWALTDFRRPDPTAAITWDGRTIDPAEASVEAMAGTTVVGVRLHHPVFAELLDAVSGPEDPAAATAEREVTQIGFMLLQLVLGEEGFGLWVGDVVLARERPEGAVALAELPGIIARVAEACPVWYGMEAVNKDLPVHVTARAPLSPLVDPLLTRHVVVQLLYSEVDAEGLPGPGSARALDEIGRAMAEAPGDEGVFVAAETSDGLRLLHFYVDPEGPGEGRIRELAAGWDQGEHAVDAADDPGWLRVAHLRA